MPGDSILVPIGRYKRVHDWEVNQFVSYTYSKAIVAS